MSTPSPPDIQKPTHSLHGHESSIRALAWSPDGHKLASASNDSTVRIWSLVSGRLKEAGDVHVLRATTRHALFYSVAWSLDGRLIAATGLTGATYVWDANTGDLREKLVPGTVSDAASMDYLGITVAWSPIHESILAVAYTDSYVRLWDVTEGKVKTLLRGHDAEVFSIAWSPDGRVLASGSTDGTVRFWNALTGDALFRVQAQFRYVAGLAWSPDGHVIAVTFDDGTIGLCDTATGDLLNVLEGHAGELYSVSFSADGSFLASRASDAVRIWRCDTWEPVMQYDDTPHDFMYPGVAFHPTGLTLAAIGENNRVIHIWSLDRDSLLNSQPVVPSVHYTNAKVVLLGDSGVGKSGLGLVLSNQPFAATESTHGRRIWMFDSAQVTLANNRMQTRETLLWDLAGQPGYRLIHQLHLNEVVVALVVMDARSEIDPFAGVRHWDRALRQAQLVQGDKALPWTKFLVAARIDRGRIGVSQERIDGVVRELEFAGYFATSAKEGTNITELREAIRNAIDWDKLPNVSSNELFQRMKAFLIAEKEAGRRLSTVQDLYYSFRRAKKAPRGTKISRPQFETCIGRIEAADLIRRLSFGDLVLLQPELLDAYASALVNAAKDEPDGLGSIAEDVAREGRFPMSAEERIDDKEQEKLLLIATVENLLRHEIVLREETAEGVQLVFPSQLTREHPDLPDPEGKAVIFSFTGPLLSIYARLAVRLSHSGVFRKGKMWKNAVTYNARVGGSCGMYLREIEEGRGQLVLFFDEAASEETRYLFEYYVQEHLERWALPDSVERRRIFVCQDPECATAISEEQASKRRNKGFMSIRCPVCEQEVSLRDREDRLATPRPAKIIEMDRAADVQRQRDMAISVLQGKVETKDFDVFLAHNSVDKPQIRVIAEELKQRGLYPWLDEQDLRPGSPTQDEIERVLSSIPVVAVFVGPNGPGPWESIEARVAMSLYVKKKLRVIPVLLPGIEKEPELPLFLKELHWVRFVETPGDVAALDKLQWGITGVNPSKGLR